MDWGQLSHSLARPRRLGALSTFEERMRGLFTPSDWLIAGIFGALMLAGSLALLASVSISFSVEAPLKGGTHVEGVVGSVRFVNPLLAISDADRDLVALTFAGLMHENADGSLAGNLASSYEISEDGKTYTFHISPKAFFHDGTPVTADDVIFTVHAAQDPAVKSPLRPDWEGVSVTAPDPGTVIFTLNEAYAPFLRNATMGILPKHLWQGVSADQFSFSNLNVEPVGAGPYRTTDIIRDRSGVPTEYRLAASTKAVTVPYIARMTLRFYADAEALAAAVRTGTVDAAASIVAPGTGVLHEAPYGRVFAVFMNQNENEVFADEGVRRALDTALDKEALVTTILLGYGTPLASPLPPRSLDAVSASPMSPAERMSAASTILIKDGWRFASSTATSSAAWTKTTGTGKTKKTVSLAFTLSTANDPVLKGAAEWVSGAWKELGADVTLEVYDQGDLAASVIRPRKYESLLFGEVVGEAGDLFAFWHSSQRNDPGLNIALYTNSAVDKLLEAARKETDPAKRIAGTDAAAATIAKETAAIFLYAPSFTYVTEKGLSGVSLGTVTVPADRFRSVTNWYLMTERVWKPFAARPVSDY